MYGMTLNCALAAAALLSAEALLPNPPASNTSQSWVSLALGHVTLNPWTILSNQLNAL